MESSSVNTAYTTNEEDQREVARLQVRLEHQKKTAKKGSETRLPSVEIADGTHKYVLIKGELHGDEQYIVTSRNGAHYHRNAAEPMIEKLDSAGYDNIQVTGGGRISCDHKGKEIRIYGFSYGFGLANHAISKSLVEADPRYADYSISISDEGY
jgi:phosphohistidine phosphatase